MARESTLSRRTLPSEEATRTQTDEVDQTSVDANKKASSLKNVAAFQPTVEDQPEDTAMEDGTASQTLDNTPTTRAEHQLDTTAHAHEHENASEHVDEQQTEDDSWLVAPRTDEDDTREEQEQHDANHDQEEPQIDYDESQEHDVQEEDIDRRHSSRTEALIQAAAKAVVQTIKQTHEEHAKEPESDFADTSLQDTSYDQLTDAEPGGDHVEGTGDKAAHQESQHISDEDVFSDQSPRTSIDSSGADAISDDDHSNGTLAESAITPRKQSDVSRMSHISRLSRYDEEGFIPTPRGTPRAAYQSPSTYRNVTQMTSPTPSVYSGSPRSPKRRPQSRSQMSRYGSPHPSRQETPKRQSTPQRFKRPEEAPLVLLHVTLLPLRWIWGDILNTLEARASKWEESHTKVSASIEHLQSAWRQLQDRLGDTVLERGILLPHPQNDFELLEERLLEALELPLRRRARILECGHYLGPSNEIVLEASDAETETETESEVDGHSRSISRRSQRAKGRHWCRTCRSEISYEALGADRVFKSKVYASNGLMKAGAWDACWKEMERVDIEVEPILSDETLAELQALSTALLEEAQREQAAQDAEMMQEQVDSHAFVEAVSPEAEPIREEYPQIEVSPPSGASLSDEQTSPTPSPSRRKSSSRRRREAERLREIYGETGPVPPTIEEVYDEDSHLHPESARRRRREAREFDSPDTPRDPNASADSSQAWATPLTPASPIEEAVARRQSRRKSLQSASLTDLVAEAGKVIIRDPKNIAIVVLGILILIMALRTSPQHRDTQVVEQVLTSNDSAVIGEPEILLVEKPEVAVMQEPASPLELPMAQETVYVTVTATSEAAKPTAVVAKTVQIPLLPEDERAPIEGH